MDVFSPEKRSEVMSLIRSKNTKPELAVRSFVHKLGYRFRIHRRDLPGRPDIVLAKHRKVIFVHGCFWHAHECEIAKLPQSRLSYWLPKLQKTKERDILHRKALTKQGWDVLEIWECEVRKDIGLSERVSQFMKRPTPQ